MARSSMPGVYSVRPDVGAEASLELEMSLVYTANSRPHPTLPLPPEKQNVNSKAVYYLDPLHQGWQRAFNSPVVRT